MQYNLKKIARQQKTSKAGKPYESVGIQVAEYGETWINGFGNKGNATWKEGDVVELEITDNVYNGRTTKKFEMPKKVTASTAEIEFTLAHIHTKLDRIIDHLSGKSKMGVTSAGTPVPFQEPADDGFDAWAEEEANKF